MKIKLAAFLKDHPYDSESVRATSLQPGAGSVRVTLVPAKGLFVDDKDKTAVDDDRDRGDEEDVRRNHPKLCGSFEDALHELKGELVRRSDGDRRRDPFGPRLEIEGGYIIKAHRE